ncbi:MAG TPA: RagB/SusD family nutrient uptake outer membrane protein [Cytophagaceae bacterium]
MRHRSTTFFLLSFVIIQTSLGQVKLYSPIDVMKALNISYSIMQGPELYGSSYLKLVELESDDITINEANPEDLAIDNLRLTPETGTSTVCWQQLYRGVKWTNLILTKGESVDMDPVSKQRIFAEAKFLRAFYNWHIMNLFGGAPLFKSYPQDSTGFIIPKSSEIEMYEHIVSDLKDAEAVLPEAYDIMNKGRATKYAAKALLGKAYLFNQEWSRAKEKFAEIINSKMYQLCTNYRENFDVKSENNSESIFEIQYKSQLNTNMAGVFYSAGANSGEGSFRNVNWGMKAPEVGASWGQLIVTKDLVNEFEPNDPRLAETLFLVGDTAITFDPKYSATTPKIYSQSFFRNVKAGQSGPTGRYFHVKKGNPGGERFGDSPNNWRLIRFADVILMYAEALAESGDLGNAVIQLNLIRKRARGGNQSLLPDFPYVTKYGGNVIPGATEPSFLGKFVSLEKNLFDFRKALVHERRVELAIEAVRYLDLKRWSRIQDHPGSAIAIFAEKSLPASLDEDKKLYSTGKRGLQPIPREIIMGGNDMITQNPGY